MSKGDCNSKFFHKVVNGRRNRNCINKLELRDGTFVEDDDATEHKIIQFFQTMYTK